jgi:hypothetical protein
LRTSDGDDDFPLSVSFFQIPDGLWNLGERVLSVDDRCELAEFNELLDNDQVLVGRPTINTSKLLTSSSNSALC